MVKVLKNYSKTGKMLEEFAHVKLRKDVIIFYDMPICICDLDTEYKDPVIVNDGSIFPVCMEKEEVKTIIKDTELLNLDINEDGSLKPSQSAKPMLSIRVPKGTDINELEVKNGKLMKKQNQVKEEEKQANE